MNQQQANFNQMGMPSTAQHPLQHRQEESFWKRWQKTILIGAACLLIITGIILLVYFVWLRDEKTDGNSTNEKFRRDFPPEGLKSISAKAKFLRDSYDRTMVKDDELSEENGKDFNTKNLEFKTLPVKTDLNTLSYKNDRVQVVTLNEKLLERLEDTQKFANEDPYRECMRKNDQNCFVRAREKMLEYAKSSMRQLEKQIKSTTNASDVQCLLPGTNMRSSKSKNVARLFHLDFYNFEADQMLDSTLRFKADEMVNVWMNTKDEYMRNFHLGFIQRKFIKPKKGKPAPLGALAESFTASSLSDDVHISIPELESMKFGEAIVFSSTGDHAPPHSAVQTIFNTESGEKQFKDYERISVEFRCAVKH